MDYRRSWMYGSLRSKPGFRSEVDNFITVAERHARTSTPNTREILCPCSDCKNHIAWRDVTVIRSHLIMRGFVKDYTKWIHHGETVDEVDAVAEATNARDRISAFIEELDAEENLNSTQCGDPGFAIGGESVGGYGGCAVEGDEAASNNGDPGRAGDEEDGDYLEEMLRAIGPELLLKNAKGLENLERVKKAAKERLYGVDKGCPRHWTVLRFVLELVLLKAKYGWSDCSFNDLLSLLSWLLPQPNSVPSNTYEAKKVISPLTLGVEKIHACRNHCILFRGDLFKDLDKCPRCGASRYKDNEFYSGDEAFSGKRKKAGGKVVAEPEPQDNTALGNDAKQRRIPALVMWYLPVVDRLRRIFLHPEEAALMSWWQRDRKVEDGTIAHPADGTQWQLFDSKYPEFSSDPRNVRFGLSTDGMNPFNERTSNHSTWPVILTMYNIPTWLCQKRKYLMLTILIQGPKQPGIDIDVFLEPLMQEMEILWKFGVPMVDASRKEEFICRAIIFTTTNDYPALFSLSGQIKGKTACVTCLVDTKSVYLNASKKTVYLGYRRFLKATHRYRSKVFFKHYNNKAEHESAPQRCKDGKYVFEMVKNLHVIFGKKNMDGTKRDRSAPPVPGVPFKKQSIFFRYLPYWSDLEVPHAIDGMHLKKNVCESVVGLLMDIPGKTKDGLKSRRDMAQLEVKPELHAVPQGNGKFLLPAASYNLTVDERRAVCNFIRGLKVPTGFSGNLKRLVSMNDLSITRFKAHDCHVMLTVFLPIAIRAIQPEFVKMAVTRMCYFFAKISQKTINSNELDMLQEFAVETQNQLEMCFPPAFFDIMPHLMIHMVDQIRALGPCYLHEMWTYERFMSILNRYVLNRAYPEGSMIEGYNVEEIVECCQNYLKEKRGLGLPESRHMGRLAGKGAMGRKAFIDKDYKEVDRAHYSVLQSLEVMQPYIDAHLDYLRARSNGRTEDWVRRQHRLSLTTWMRELEIPDGESIDDLTVRRLADGPSSQVTSWKSYDINGYTFSTSARDKNCVTQNSGVRIDAVDSAGRRTTYYGIIDDIWELDYGLGIQMVLFRCRWFKGHEVDGYGLTLVDMNNVGYKDDPWVLGSRVAQVFYLPDPYSDRFPKRKRKHVVVSGKQRIIGVDNVDDAGEYNNYDEMELFVDFPKKISVVERSLPKDTLPWERKDVTTWKIVSG